MSNAMEMASVVEFLTTRFHSVEKATDGKTLIVMGAKEDKDLHVEGNDRIGFTIRVFNKGVWDGGGEVTAAARTGLQQALIAMGAARRDLS